MMIALLDNIRSLHNVGSMFRTADGAGVAKLYLCGYTGTPPRREIAKVALGAEDSVPWEYRKDIRRLIVRLKKEGWTIVALEQTEKSIAYTSMTLDPCLRGDDDKKIALIVGNEVEGISPKTLVLADITLHIPMRGVKESLNVFRR